MAAQLPRELIPLAAKPGERVEMHLRDLKLAAGTTVKLSVQAVDGAGNLGPAATAEITVSSHVPAPLPQPKPQPDSVPNPTVAAWPVGGMKVAIIDELDKVHPTTGELIPPQFRGYLATNHLWNAQSRTITLQAARNEFVAFQVLIGGDKAAATHQARAWFRRAGRQGDPGGARPLLPHSDKARSDPRPDRSAQLSRTRHTRGHEPEPARRGLCSAYRAGRPSSRHS